MGRKKEKQIKTLQWCFAQEMNWTIKNISENKKNFKLYHG